MFFEQFERICQEKGTTPSRVVLTLGFSASKVTAWKSGSLPKADMLQRLANHLGVEVHEFFLNAPFSIPEQTSTQTNELIDVFLSLDIRGQTKVLATAYEEQDRMKHSGGRAATEGTVG